MAQASNVDDITLEKMDVFFGGDDLGFTEVDSLALNFGEGIIPVSNVDQFFGTIKSFSQGFAFTVTMTLKNTARDFLMSKILRLRSTLKQDGSGNKAFFVGNTQVNLVADSDVLLLRRVGAGTDRSNDVLFHLANPDLSGAALAFSRDTPQVFAVTFTIFPDLNQAAGEELAIFGDPGVTDAVPAGVWIATGAKSLVQGVHLSALDLNLGEIQQLQAFRSAATSDGVTFDVDEVGDVSATDVEFNYDALSSPSSIVAGDVILIGTEYIFIGSVTFATATTGNVADLVRGIWGSTAAIHLNNATATQQQNVGILLVTDTAAWVSSVPGDVTVGDLFQGSLSDATNKGVIEWISTGTSNVKATFNTKDSPDLVVTTN